MGRFRPGAPTIGLRVRQGVMRLVVLAALVAAGAVLFAASTEDYGKRQASLDADLAAEHYALGLWACEQKLLNEAREQFEYVLQLDPGHKEAAARLAELTNVTRKTKNLKCEIEMLSGEKVKAEMLMPNLRLQTSSGFLLIPTSEIDLIEVGAGPAPDHIISDAFVGDGQLKAETFSLQSKVGIVNPKRIDVKSIRIFRPCPACDGAGQAVCRRCSGTGRLTEKSVCPDCNGKGKIKCATCGGAGKITCPLCGGRGRFEGFWGRYSRATCPRCQGTGKVDCPDCKGAGMIECPTCKGKPQGAKAGVCPVCNGAKVIACQVCGGTGTKPLPKPETEEPKPEPPKPEAPAPKDDE